MAVLPAVMSSSTRAYKPLPLISCSRFLVAGPRWGSGTAHGPGVSRSPPGARTVSPSPCCARGCVRLRTTTTGVAELGGRIRFGRDPSAGVPSSVRRRPSTSLEGGGGRTAGVEDDRATLDHPLDEGAIQTVGERTSGPVRAWGPPREPATADRRPAADTGLLPSAWGSPGGGALCWGLAGLWPRVHADLRSCTQC